MKNSIPSIAKQIKRSASEQIQLNFRPICVVPANNFVEYCKALVIDLEKMQDNLFRMFVNFARKKKTRSKIF